MTLTSHYATRYDGATSRRRAPVDLAADDVPALPVQPHPRDAAALDRMPWAAPLGGVPAAAPARAARCITPGCGARLGRYAAKSLELVGRCSRCRHRARFVLRPRAVPSLPVLCDLSGCPRLVGRVTLATTPALRPLCEPCRASARQRAAYTRSDVASVVADLPRRGMVRP